MDDGRRAPSGVPVGHVDCGPGGPAGRDAVSYGDLVGFRFQETSPHEGVAHCDPCAEVEKDGIVEVLAVDGGRHLLGPGEAALETTDPIGAGRRYRGAYELDPVEWQNNLELRASLKERLGSKDVGTRSE